MFKKERNGFIFWRNSFRMSSECKCDPTKSKEYLQLRGDNMELRWKLTSLLRDYEELKRSQGSSPRPLFSSQGSSPRPPRRAQEGALDSPRRPCTFFNTGRGCRKGEQCDFAHTLLTPTKKPMVVKRAAATPATAAAPATAEAPRAAPALSSPARVKKEASPTTPRRKRKRDSKSVADQVLHGSDNSSNSDSDSSNSSSSDSD